MGGRVVCHEGNVSFSVTKVPECAHPVEVLDIEYDVSSLRAWPNGKLVFMLRIAKQSRA